MCVAAIALGVHRQYPLLIISNRDEFYTRATQPLHKWDEHPAIYAGRDLEGGGTWLGITENGRWALLTNYRQVPETGTFNTTRGELVVQFLKDKGNPADFGSWLEDQAKYYNGFNLLYGSGADGWYFSNMSGQPAVALESGIYGLSNHLLDTPWQKVQRVKEVMAAFVAEGSAEDIFHAMKDETPCPDDTLPDTGLDKDREKQLSPVFIRTQDYGTCCTTLAQMSGTGCHIEERSFVPENNLSCDFGLVLGVL